MSVDKRVARTIDGESSVMKQQDAKDEVVWAIAKMD